MLETRLQNKKSPYLLSAGLLILSSLLFTGCTSNPKVQSIAANSLIPLSDLNHWRLKARVAIKTSDDNVTASLDWQKDQSLFDFLLSGSFGTTIAHLTQQKNRATLKTPDSEELFHNNAEQLLNQTLGWEFPIDALSYWVKGLPSGKPGEKISYGSQGQISQIQLNGWTIIFSNYRLFQGYLLPKMIKATRPNIALKVVAKKWFFLE